MPTVVLSTPPYLYFSDNDGNPLSGGKIETYLAGTTTPQATYTDAGGGTPNANPVICDSSGRTVIFLDNSVSYKYIVKDSLNNIIRTVDNITPFTVSGSIASGSVTNTMLANMAANTIKVRAASTSGVPSDLAIAASQVVGRGASGDVRAVNFSELGGGSVKTTTTASASANITFSSLDFANNTYEFYFNDIVCATDNTNFELRFSPDNFSSSVDSSNQAYGYDSAVAASIGGEVAMLKFMESARTTITTKLRGALFISQLVSGVAATGTFGVTAQGQTNPSLMNGVTVSVTAPATFFNAVRFQMSSGNITSGSITMIKKPIT